MENDFEIRPSTTDSSPVTQNNQTPHAEHNPSPDSQTQTTNVSAETSPTSSPNNQHTTKSIAEGATIDAHNAEATAEDAPLDSFDEGATTKDDLPTSHDTEVATGVAPSSSFGGENTAKDAPSSLHGAEATTGSIPLSPHATSRMPVEPQDEQARESSEATSEASAAPSSSDQATTASAPIDPHITGRMQPAQITTKARPLSNLGTDTQKANDAEEALNSLDITMRRPLPDFTSLWSEDERRPAREEERSHRWHIPTGILLAIVASVSFVAGGVTARLVTQAPLLFAEKQEAVESTASYEYTPKETQTEQTTPEDDSQTTTDPWDTTDSWDSTDTWNTTPRTDTDDTRTDDTDQTTDTWDDSRDDDSFSWYWGPDDSISYDRDRDRVTIDYDDTEISFDMDDLWGRPDTTDSTPEGSSPYPYDDSPGYGDDYGRRDSGWGDSWT